MADDNPNPLPMRPGPVDVETVIVRYAAGGEKSVLVSAPWLAPVMLPTTRADLMVPSQTGEHPEGAFHLQLDGLQQIEPDWLGGTLTLWDVDGRRTGSARSFRLFLGADDWGQWVQIPDPVGQCVWQVCLRHVPYPQVATVPVPELPQLAAHDPEEAA